MKELTKGEKLVGLTFNPSGDKDVIKIKKAAAAFIDAVGQSDAIVQGNNDIIVGFVDRAIEDAISAQMFAVKAVTWKAE